MTCTKPRLLLLACLTVSALQAQASSEQAWAASDRQMNDRCLAASQLKGTRVLGSPAMFDDSVGYSALLLEGRYRPAHMKNRSGRELCLFHRSTGRAVVTEWDGAVKAR